MRKINFRPILFVLVSFCFALVFARQIFIASVFHIIFVCMVLGALFAICIKYKCLKRFVLIFCSFVFGVGYYFLGFTVFSGIDYISNVLVEARVANISSTATYTYLTLDNVKINGEGKGFNISCNILGGSVEQGNIIVFEAKLNKVNLFEDDQFKSHYYKNNTPYKTSVNYENLIIKDGFLKLNEKISQKFKKFVENNYSKDIAGIVSSVIIGDKYLLDDQINDDFSLSGVGHLLAISGLHISFIISMISFVLEKLKLKRLPTFIIVLVLLAFYCYICNFSPSVTRASLMSLTYMLAKVLCRKYDRLNSISFCALLILLFKPLYIFDAGFLLSFGSVFCIFMLSSIIKDALTKLKLKRNFASTLAVTFATQLGLIPIMCLFYDSMNLLSFVTNLICVPLFEIAFILTFVLTIVCMILPFLSFILKFVELIYFLIITVASFVASLKFAVIPLTKCKNMFVVGCYGTMFLFSRFVNINKTSRLCFGIGLFGFSILLSVLI